MLWSLKLRCLKKTSHWWRDVAGGCHGSRPEKLFLSVTSEPVCFASNLSVLGLEVNSHGNEEKLPWHDQPLNLEESMETTGIRKELRGIVDV